MADIGQTLREARMRARIDITEVEERTKIRARYLRALENEEWNLLPGPVYIKSFLRTYADCLGLDGRLLIDEFRRRFEEAGEPAPGSAGLRRERREGHERERPRRAPSGRVVPPWMIIGVVLVAVVVALYAIGSGSGGNGHPTPRGPKLGVTTRRHRAKHRSAGHARRARRRPNLVTLHLVPTGTVYVCVEDRIRRRVIPGATYGVGQRIPTVHGYVLYVTLGNNLVDMTVNGARYPVASSTTAIDLKVTARRVAPIPAGQAPACA